MKLAVSLLIALLSFRAAAANECDTTVADIIHRTGAEYVRSSRSGHNHFLSHPHVPELQLDCTLSSRPLLFGAWNRNACPSRQFFAAMAVAGAVATSASPAAIEAAIRQCHRVALLPSAEEFAERVAGPANIKCHAFTRDGGAVSVHITKR
jgi:hypothetical protein